MAALERWPGRTAYSARKMTPSEVLLLGVPGKVVEMADTKVGIAAYLQVVSGRVLTAMHESRGAGLRGLRKDDENKRKALGMFLELTRAVSNIQVQGNANHIVRFYPAGDGTVLEFVTGQKLPVKQSFKIVSKLIHGA